MLATLQMFAQKENHISVLRDSRIELIAAQDELLATKTNSAISLACWVEAFRRICKATRLLDRQDIYKHRCVSYSSSDLCIKRG